MTSTDSEHFLLNAQAGWRAASLERVVLGGDGACLRLQAVPGSVRPLVDAAGSFGGLTSPTDLAVDAEDQIYILDGAAHVIRRFDPCSEHFEVLPCAGEIGSEPRQLREPHGIAISCRGDLYVADTGNRRVQIFALKGLPLRDIWGPLKVVSDDAGLRVEPVAALSTLDATGAQCGPQSDFPEGTWQPWDIALSSRNLAYVSDYSNGLIHVFDPRGCWRTAYTGAGENDRGETSPSLDKPTAIAVDKEGRLYIVQEGKSFVTVLDRDGKFVEQMTGPEQVKDRFCPIAVAVDQDGNICISDRCTRCLYYYCQSLDGCYTDAAICRDFSGLSTALAFDRAGNPLLGDAERQRVCRLEAHSAWEMEGQYISEAMDSSLYRCPWHRVLIRGSVAPGTQVRVDSFTSESPKTAEEIQSLPDARWATGQINSEVGDGEWDCLLQSPPGRYLWLRLTLIGDGTATPTVQWLRVYFPRASSLQYLPAVYSQDEVSRDFLDRFLSIFDTIQNGIAGQITDIARYFDPGGTPANGGAGVGDFLSWLASWLDLALDRHWPQEKRRELLKQAHRLYALRGTPEGLRLHIQLYTGMEPRILEHFKLRRWLTVDHARLGDQSVLWGKAIVDRLQLDEHSQIGSFQLIDSGDPLRDPFHHYAHQFSVFVPLRQSTACDSTAGESATQQDTQRRNLERIIEMAKPAHTQGHLQLVQPRFRVGVQAFIGVDTVIGQVPAQVIAGEGHLGYDTVLGPSADESGPPTMRVGVRTRIGSSTLLD